VPEPEGYWDKVPGQVLSLSTEIRLFSMAHGQRWERGEAGVGSRGAGE